MNLQKSKVLLDKITALHKNISVDASYIAKIEKDLMLSYVRQLYDALLDEDNSIAQTPVEKPVAKVQQSPPPAPKPTYKPPRIIEIPDTIKSTRTYENPRPTRRPAPAPKVVTQPKPPVPRPVVQTVAVNTDKYKSLFEFQEAKELSESLSARPINDLAKAFSLNDKLLYANELFQKDLVVFNDAVKQLNSFQSFEAAKALLAQLAEKYSWTDNSKINLAKDFVKLARRRFPNG